MKAEEHWIDKIPFATKEDLIRYRDKGIKTGDFLHHFLANDLKYTVLYSDPENYAALKEILWWAIRFLPQDSYGSFEKVSNWLNRGGLFAFPEVEQALFLARLQRELKALNRSDEL